MIPCPCDKRFRAKEKKLYTELVRKSEKIFDLEFVIKQNKIQNSLNRAMLS